MREKVELPINEIIEKYESGVSQIQLAKEYSISNILFLREYLSIIKQQEKKSLEEYMLKKNCQ